MEHRKENKVTLLRRSGALLYDSIAVIALIYFAAFLPVVLTGTFLESGNPFFILYLLVVLFSYFFCTWRRGRTFGMQVWKIQITNTDGKPPTAKQCAIRFIGATFSMLFFGLGYITAVLNTEQSTWHDRLSSTRLTRL